MALGIALIPPLVAGLTLYGLIAFVSAVLALAMGGAFHLLAVVISIAWLWYARRVSLAALIGFLLGGLLISVMLRWDPVFQLDSGPTWFVAALALADRRLLPEEPVLRPTLAFAAGVFAVGVRA